MPAICLVDINSTFRPDPVLPSPALACPTIGHPTLSTDLQSRMHSACCAFHPGMFPCDTGNRVDAPITDTLKSIFGHEGVRTFMTR